MISINEHEVKLLRFIRILKVQDDMIQVKFKHYDCILSGNKLKITYLSSLEVWITGCIDHLDFIYE